MPESYLSPDVVNVRLEFFKDFSTVREAMCIFQDAIYTCLGMVLNEDYNKRFIKYYV